MPLYSTLKFFPLFSQGKQYQIEPDFLELHKSSHANFYGDKLKVDTEWVKKISGREVKLSHDLFETGKNVSLRFEFKDAAPDPYLGALGHVVIIDSDAEKFILVIPFPIMKLSLLLISKKRDIQIVGRV